MRLGRAKTIHLQQDHMYTYTAKKDEKTRQLNRYKPCLTSFGSVKANAELAIIMESEQPISGPGSWLEKSFDGRQREVCALTQNGTRRFGV